MKKIVFAPLAALIVATGCTSKEKLEKAEQQSAELNTELQATLATQDSLFALINERSEGMNQIKDMEHIIATPGLNGDTQSGRAELRNDMASIRQALQQRRERLAQLEENLKNSNGKNATLMKTIENLKQQISSQESEIAQLNSKLSAAGVEIASLGAKVDSLSSTVTAVTTEREEARQEATQLTDELNTCYFAIGTKKELQDNQIIQTGFLRKTKIMEGDFEKNYFTRADKRTLVSIPLHSKKAEVMTKQPKDTYEIVEGDQGQKILKILDPARFWELSNFLVVKVD